MPALTIPLICICACLPQSYRAREGDLGHHTHRVYGRAGEGWGGLGRLQGAVLMFIYGLTDLRI